MRIRKNTLTRAAALPALLLGLLLLPGCGLLYQNHYQGSGFVLHSDLDRQFLEEIGPDVEQIYGGFEDLFGISPRTEGRTSIILRGSARDQEVVDMTYSPSLLGYYIPFLNLISVDTKPAWTREPVMLKQILLHEIAHHYIVSEWPKASKECWLNEGLAGNLEMALFEDGKFEYPLLNPVLLGIVRHNALIHPGGGELKKLIGLGWSEFHGESNKELDYAMSWAIVYYLLEHHLPADLPLGERIERLYSIDREEVAALEPRWLEFIRDFDLTGKLMQMAQAGDARGKLTARWAARQLGYLKFLDDERSAPVLVSLLDAEDPVLAVHASLSFLKVLARSPTADAPALRRGRDRIVSRLLDDAQPAVLREILAGGLGDLLRSDPSWIPLLIRLLEAPEGEVRAAAAQGLGAAQVKPTIVNPAFWREGQAAARTAEVSEWQAWWASHRAASALDASVDGRPAGKAPVERADSRKASPARALVGERLLSTESPRSR